MTHKELQSLKPKDIISKYIGDVLVEFKLLNRTSNGWHVKRLGADVVWDFNEQGLLKCEIEYPSIWGNDDDGYVGTD
jgi:hypothetical protein